MTEQLSEDQNPRTNKTWWQRNWKWFVPTALVGCFLLLCGFILSILFIVMGSMKSSGAYELAISRAMENQSVLQALGEPIEAGFFVTGSIQTSGGSGSADLSIPISGPQGEATLYVTATKQAGKWMPERVIVQLEHAQRINLMEHQE